MQNHLFVEVYFWRKYRYLESLNNHLFRLYQSAPLAHFLWLKRTVSLPRLFFSLPLFNLPSTPSISDSQDFCYETWCVFFLAPRSVSSVPLLHYRSTAPLSPTLKGMQTHIKGGPLILKISRLCSSYFLPSYLSVNVICMLVGSLSWQHTPKHTHTFTWVHTVNLHTQNDRLTNCCPTLLTWQTQER